MTDTQSYRLMQDIGESSCLETTLTLMCKSLYRADQPNFKSRRDSPFHLFMSISGYDTAFEIKGRST